MLLEIYLKRVTFRVNFKLLTMSCCNLFKTNTTIVSSHKATFQTVRKTWSHSQTPSESQNKSHKRPSNPVKIWKLGLKTNNSTKKFREEKHRDPSITGEISTPIIKINTQQILTHLVLMIKSESIIFSLPSYAYLIETDCVCGHDESLDFYNPNQINN